jgi:hypothetical protein
MCSFSLYNCSIDRREHEHGWKREACEVRLFSAQKCSTNLAAQMQVKIQYKIHSSRFKHRYYWVRVRSNPRACMKEVCHHSIRGFFHTPLVQCSTYMVHQYLSVRTRASTLYVYSEYSSVCRQINPTVLFLHPFALNTNKDYCKVQYNVQSGVDKRLKIKIQTALKNSVCGIKSRQPSFILSFLSHSFISRVFSTSASNHPSRISK